MVECSQRDEEFLIIPSKNPRKEVRSDIDDVLRSARRHEELLFFDNIHQYGEKSFSSALEVEQKLLHE